MGEALRNELRYYLISPKHPFFKRLHNEMRSIMHRLCDHGFKSQCHAEDEVIFVSGERAKKTYFYTEGAVQKALDYSPAPSSGGRLDPPPRPDECISEAVLWIGWRHHGELKAIRALELLQLDPEVFVKVMGLHPRPWFLALSYASCFLDFINRLPRSELLDILRNKQFYADAASVLTTASAHQL